MNEEEKKVMNALVKAHNLYIKLESTHPIDNSDWCDAIHKLQDIISRRIVRRDYPKQFITIKKK